MTPREADIAYALEGIDDIDALFAVGPLDASTGPDKNVEVVVQVRAHSLRAQARVGARLAAEFDGSEPPFVVFVDANEMSAPRFMHRSTALSLSPSEREEARARSGLRQMRREACAPAKPPRLEARKRASRDRRACIALVHEQSADVRRSLAAVDAEVRVLPPSRGAFLEYALADLDSGEIDLFILDAQTAWDHGRRLLAVIALYFGEPARDHVLLVERGHPSWTSMLVRHYPSLSLPSELAKLPSVLDRATRWRRVEERPELERPR